MKIKFIKYYNFKIITQHRSLFNLTQYFWQRIHLHTTSRTIKPRALIFAFFYISLFCIIYMLKMSKNIAMKADWLEIVGCRIDTLILIRNHHIVYTIYMRYIYVVNIFIRSVSKRKKTERATKFYSPQPLIMYRWKKKQKICNHTFPLFSDHLAYIRHWNCEFSYPLITIYHWMFDFKSVVRLVLFQLGGKKLLLLFNLIFVNYIFIFKLNMYFWNTVNKISINWLSTEQLPSIIIIQSSNTCI